MLIISRTTLHISICYQEQCPHLSHTDYLTKAALALRLPVPAAQRNTQVFSQASMSLPPSVSEITSFLNSELHIDEYSDMAFNGLQIQSPVESVTTVAFAVDSGLSVVEQAIALKAQLLVVHHGVYWGKVEPLVGPWAKKATLCLTKGLSLYAAHLPLDGHAVLGNAAQIATSVLNALEVTPDFEYHGAPIGTLARLRNPMELHSIASLLRTCEGVTSQPLVLPFGKTTIETVGIVTGSGTSMIPTIAGRHIDLLISGEAKQEAYHLARELECSVIFMGHYASETFGVKALQRVLESRFSVKTEWISEPTGI
jgi:dinuclear metal center YbgI/SA1388 family protein